MAEIGIQNIDSHLLEKLQTRAKWNRRSLEAELRVILQEAVEERTTEMLAEVDRVRALFAGCTFENSVPLLREDRDR